MILTFNIYHVFLTWNGSAGIQVLLDKLGERLKKRIRKGKGYAE